MTAGAQVLRGALPVLDGVRPSGVLGWAGPVAPVVTRAAVGTGHWAAGRRQRALAAWTSAAGYGLVAWGLGTEAPAPAQARQNMLQNIERMQREGVLREPGPEAQAAAGTQTPPARQQESEHGVRGFAGDREHRQPPRPAQAPPHADDHPHDSDSRFEQGVVHDSGSTSEQRIVPR